VAQTDEVAAPETNPQFQSPLLLERTAAGTALMIVYCDVIGDEFASSDVKGSAKVMLDAMMAMVSI
jgi:hypothetical protein